MRAVRLFHVFEALQAAGPRGLTTRQILDRLEAWGDDIEERQLQRDIKTLRDTMGMPIATSRDLDSEQQSDGSRVIYLIDRRGLLPSDFVSTGRAIACFEATGHRMWGKAIDEGWVLLHRIQAATSGELARSLATRFVSSYALYLGQFHFEHFVLEVPHNIERDVTVRVGRIERARQAPDKIDARDILVGLEGRHSLSRLFGERQGHVAIHFQRHAGGVTVETLTHDAQFRIDARAPEEAYERTPIHSLADIKTALFRLKPIEESGLIFFGGVVMYVWLGNRTK